MINSSYKCLKYIKVPKVKEYAFGAANFTLAKKQVTLMKYEVTKVPKVVEFC